MIFQKLSWWEHPIFYLSLTFENEGIQLEDRRCCNYLSLQKPWGKAYHGWLVIGSIGIGTVWPTSKWYFLSYCFTCLRHFKCNLSLQSIPRINLWNKCIDLRLFSKCFAVPFLRPLRSKCNQSWIFRLKILKVWLPIL